MKKGKTSKLNLYKEIKTNYGTVDSKNLKSIFINIQSWAEPTDEYDNWNRIVNNLSRQIKHTVYEHYNRAIFNDTFIVDLDLRTSGIMYGKKSFMNLEVNLYLKNEMDFKSNTLKNEVKKIIQMIYKDSIIKNHFFTFSSSKKESISIIA